VRRARREPQQTSGLTERERAADVVVTGRRKTGLERYDRNLSELMGELRVALPGVEVLFASRRESSAAAAAGGPRCGRRLVDEGSDDPPPLRGHAPIPPSARAARCGRAIGAPGSGGKAMGPSPHVEVIDAVIAPIKAENMRDGVVQLDLSRRARRTTGCRLGEKFAAN